jgi:glycolate oxidase FAD binding subunit
MSATVIPKSEAELAEIVASASEPFEIAGAGTKRGFGRPVQAARTLAGGADAGDVGLLRCRRL